MLWDVARRPGNSCWWPRAESNHRHADFQSAALPTELLGRELAIISAALCVPSPRRPPEARGLDSKPMQRRSLLRWTAGLGALATVSIRAVQPPGRSKRLA